MHEFVATTDDLLKCNHLPKCLPHRGPVTDSFNGFCCKRYLVFLSLTELQAFQNFWHCHFKNNLILSIELDKYNCFLHETSWDEVYVSTAHDKGIFKPCDCTVGHG